MHQARHPSNTIWVVGCVDETAVYLRKPTSARWASDVYPVLETSKTKYWRWNVPELAFWKLDKTLTADQVISVMEALVDEGYCTQKLLDILMEELAKETK